MIDFRIPWAESEKFLDGCCYVRDMAHKHLAPGTWFEIRAGFPWFIDPSTTTKMVREIGYAIIENPDGKLWEFPITPLDFGRKVEMAYSAVNGYWLVARLRVPHEA